MKLIGISGKKYSGKDTFFKVFHDLEPNSIRLAFADALKDEVWRTILEPEGIDRAVLDDERKKYFRLILQGWGTEFRRQFCDDNYWIDQADKKIQELEATGFDGFLLITDVRYPNEAKWIREKGGEIIRINRPRTGLIGKMKDFFNIVPDKHPSEIALDNYKKFSAIIKNDGTVLDLIPKVRIFIESING